MVIGNRGHLRHRRDVAGDRRVAERPDALLYGLWPFLPGEVVKLLVAAGLLPIGWRLVARRDHDL